MGRDTFRRQLALMFGLAVVVGITLGLTMPRHDPPLLPFYMASFAILAAAVLLTAPKGIVAAVADRGAAVSDRSYRVRWTVNIVALVFLGSFFAFGGAAIAAVSSGLWAHPHAGTVHHEQWTSLTSADVIDPLSATPLGRGDVINSRSRGLTTRS